MLLKTISTCDGYFFSLKVSMMIVDNILAVYKTRGSGEHNFLSFIQKRLHNRFLVSISILSRAIK